MSRYDSLAYRQRTGQMTADDYRTERNNVLQQLTTATRQNAELATELEQAFQELEQARATITEQQERIDAAYTYLDEYFGNGHPPEVQYPFCSEEILQAFYALKDDKP